MLSFPLKVRKVRGENVVFEITICYAYIARIVYVETFNYRRPF